jgi:hypothetical protein
MSTPLHTVKRDFGSKEALVKKLMPLLERGEDESQADFQDRLMRVSNRKLLRLLERESTLRERFGDRDGLVDQIVTLRTPGTKPDADLRTKLSGQSTGRLLSMHWGLERAAKRDA